MLKSKKFILAAGGLLIEAAFLIFDYSAAESWASFFWKVYLTFVGINQLQKWIEKK